MSTGVFQDVNGERVEMTEEEVAAMEAFAPVMAWAPVLTVRVFRARFEVSEADMDIYDALNERMRAERRSLVRDQWADPDARIIEETALYNAIAAHLDALVTPDRKAELLS